MLADESPLPKWYANKVGSKLIDSESQVLNALLGEVCGFHLVFIGEPALSDMILPNLVPHHVVVHPKAFSFKGRMSPLPGEMNTIPLTSDSVDVVILGHTLELSLNPHEVLREAYRILIPEGHIIITGINPLSCWGGWYSYKRLRGKFSPQGNMLSANRIKDWLSLLSFQVVDLQKYHFRPPMGADAIDERLRYLDTIGKYVWPFWGGGYVLQAVKRVVPLTPVKKSRPVKEKIWEPTEGIPKPTTRTASKEIKT